MMIFSFAVARAEVLLTPLEPQSIEEALRTLAGKTGIQLFYSPDLVANVRTKGAAAGQSPEDALRELLQGTGLTYQFINSHTVAILATSQLSGIPAVAPKGSDMEIKSPMRPTGLSKSMIMPVSDAGVSDSSNGETTTNLDKSLRSAERTIDEVVVTGTHIRGIAPDSSPVTIYTRQDIERSGVGTVDQFVRTIPQNFGAVDSSTARVGGVGQESAANGFNGAAVNLHGIGSGGTLVLVNGHRIAAAGSDGSFVDVSMIPLAAVERIEVLTDGASAIYGADAVAGVINFILRKDFEGAQTSMRYGDTTDGGSDEAGASQLLGTSWRNGNAMLVYDYQNQGDLRADQRDYIPASSASGPSGAFSLLPRQKRHSVYLTGGQTVSSNLEMSGDLYYGARDYVQDSNVTNVPQRRSGTVEQYGGVLATDITLGSHWTLSSDVSYSRVDQNGQTTSASNTTRSEVRSRLSSFELSIEGPIYSIAGGDVRASIGTLARQEAFRVAPNSVDQGADLKRNIFSIYGEIFIPMVGQSNGKMLAKRLELTLAGRYDHYQALGASVKPKLGVLWSPIQGLNLRSTYAESFRVPTLYSLNESQLYALYPIPDPGASDGVTDTLFNLTSGNVALSPESSRSYTIGFELSPRQLSGFSVSANYFSIDFEDRISVPPVVGAVFGIYTQPALVPFIDRSPDSGELQRINDSGSLFDPFSIGAANAEAIVDLRLQNIAATKESGIAVNSEYSFTTPIGSFTASLLADYLFKLAFKPTTATPAVQNLNKTFQPIDLRMRGGVGWSRNGFSSSMFINYSDNYENTLVDPAGSVDSWITADWQVSYRTNGYRASILDGTTFSLNVLNLTNQQPPVVPYGPQLVNFNFDPANASPKGRFISLQITKRW